MNTKESNNRENMDKTAFWDDFKKAIFSGDTTEVKKLATKNNVDASTLFDQGDTILHLAVRSGLPEMVRFTLKEFDCSKTLGFQNRRANTAFCLAVQLAKPNTQLFDIEVRTVLRKKYEAICLDLIDADPNIKEHANTKNLMRKSAIDYLSKTVRSKIISSSLEDKIAQQIAREANIPEEVRNSLTMQKDSETSTPTTPRNSTKTLEPVK